MSDRDAEAGPDGGSARPPAEDPDPDSGLAGLDRDVRLLTEVVNRLRRALRASIRTEYTWESLPMAQVELLQCLAERNGARVGELAALLRLAPNSVSTLVQHLADAGYLHRERDPADRRAALLRLTPGGAAALAGWQRAHERRLGAALARLGDADRTAVLAALPALSNLVEALGERGEPVR